MYKFVVSMVNFDSQKIITCIVEAKSSEGFNIVLIDRPNELTGLE